jgi:hypothetical protein
MKIDFEELHALIEKYSKKEQEYLNVDYEMLISNYSIDFNDEESYINVGRGACGHPYPHSEETKKLMSQIKLGSKRSKSSREKQSKSMNGTNNHFYGKTHSAEARKIMSKKAKNRSKGAGNNNAKAIIYNEEYFGCKKFLTEKYGISLSDINKKIKAGEITYG